MDRLSEDLARTGAGRAAAAVVTDSGIIESAGDPGEVFALASVTKVLVAYAVLVATEEGTVGLDQPAGPPGSTVRHLLAHASGLGTEARDGAVAPPGTRRVYSNAGFEALATLVADESGMAFPTYLTECVFQPLAMRSSLLDGSAARDGRSSCGDLARFAAELLAPTLLSPATVELATSIAYPGLDGVLPGYGAMSPCDWGLGFEIRDDKTPHWTGRLNSPATYGHFGQSGTFLSVDPVARLGIIVLTDRPFGLAAQQSWPLIADGAIARHRG